MIKIIKFSNDIIKTQLHKEKLKIIENGGKILYTCEILPVIIIESNNSIDWSLINNIEQIEENEVGELQSFQLLPKLDFISQLPMKQYDKIKIAILDSVITTQGYNVIEKADFTGDGLDASEIFHSEIVCDIINSLTPGVQIYNAKITHNGFIKKDAFIKALDWAYSKKVDIINLSLGFQNNTCNGECIICSMVKAIADTGIIVVTTAGNSGPSIGSLTCPGNCTEAVTVGGLNINRKIADFSGRGKIGQLKPDIVTSSYVMDTQMKKIIQWGTSFSAPVITSAFIMELARKGNYSEIKNIIYKCVNNIGGLYQEYGRGAFSFLKLNELEMESEFNEDKVNTKNSEFKKSN